MTLYRNKYRIESIRLQSWDYRWQGAYFVTICTKNRERFFGDITGSKMNLSSIGMIAQSEWLLTPGLRPDMNLELGSFIVMPDHFHGIIIIGKNEYNSVFDQSIKRVKNQFGPQSKNLASIIRGFKSKVTSKAIHIDPEFAWQSNYHEHIIRDKRTFSIISKYIRNNPVKWVHEKFY